MKAARFHGPGDIRIDDVPEPTPGPGQVQVAVDWCGICGTDLHEYLEGPIFIPPKGSPHPITGAELPVVMGHEFAGVVSAVGSGVSGVAEGDKVAVEPYYVCGECVGLRRRALQHLPQARLHRAGRPGRRLRREVRGRLALDPPARRPAHRRRRAGRAARRRPTTRCGSPACKPGGTAVVFGAGPIGLVTAASLKAAGAGQVISSSWPRRASRRPPSPAPTWCSTRPRPTCRTPSAISPAAPAPTSRSSAPASTRCSRRRSARSAPAARW